MGKCRYYMAKFLIANGHAGWSYANSNFPYSLGSSSRGYSGRGNSFQLKPVNKTFWDEYLFFINLLTS
eukprot:m.20883 g.20883  ORF g.20883 m.20883 type:complete len:68 (-) comp5296_c0_seq2:102-305(-)